MSKRGGRWIISLLIAAAIISIGSLFLHKDNTETSGKHNQDKDIRTAYFNMMEHNSYPEMKEVLASKVGVPVLSISHTYVSYDEDGIRNAGSNRLEMSFYDVDQDGIEECLIANTIPTYEIGTIVLLYKQTKETMQLLGMLEMGTTKEDYTNLMSPFERHEKGDSLLYSNRKKKELYTCSYETGLIPKQINRAYRIEDGVVQQILVEVFPMTEVGQQNPKNSQFSDIGENVRFYSYEELVAKYRN